MRYTILILFTIFAFQLKAQSLRGTITDLETNEAIPMANIVVKKGQTIVEGGVCDFDGNYVISPLMAGSYSVEVSFIGYQTRLFSNVTISPSKATSLNVKLKESSDVLSSIEVTVEKYEQPLIDPYRQGKTISMERIDTRSSRVNSNVKNKRRKKRKNKDQVEIRGGRSSETIYFIDGVKVIDPINESYAKVKENQYFTTKNNPVTTFSIDVDHAAYSNVRRYINSGQKPPKDAVRIEEMVNYFDYNYPVPKNDLLHIETELGVCPWNKDNQLLHIGLQSKSIEIDEIQASNLVFLIDVSGSMSNSNKLPLVKNTLTMLTKQLRDEDRISIVVYAGAAGCVLKSTSGKNKNKILEALNNLQSGGSTAGGAGIELAYKIAQQNFIKKGNNRVILATDGDFNVGSASNESLESLISEKRESNIFLTVLGYGMGNYKDDKLEILANKGNGNYAYIDNTQEAQDFLVKGFKSSMFTLAKDVKLQLEFNPKYVKSYRLIGYENRALANTDFENDKKDAGELGAEQSVTALYEIIPQNQENYSGLTFQRNIVSNDLFDLRIRYKNPKGNKSQKISKSYKVELMDLDKTSERFRFSAAVALFGLVLKDSKHKKKADCNDIIKLAKGAKQDDESGYKAEFVRLVESYNNSLEYNGN